MIRLGKGRATTWPSAAVEFPFFHGKASEDPFLEPLPHWKEVNDNRNHVPHVSLSCVAKCRESRTRDLLGSSSVCTFHRQLLKSDGMVLQYGKLKGSSVKEETSLTPIHIIVRVSLRG